MGREHTSKADRIHHREYSGIYRDTGCFLHPSCLNCPRAVCVYDEVIMAGKHRRINDAIPTYHVIGVSDPALCATLDKMVV